MTLLEGSFGQAAQNHHFKRARYRRLWRQSIQDHLIAAVQNIKKMVQHARNLGKGSILAMKSDVAELLDLIRRSVPDPAAQLFGPTAPGRNEFLPS